jgi:glucosamine--fructose-6-phosphate aminotransferase (isomerizing)
VSPETDLEVIFPENGELAILSPSGVTFLDETGQPVEKKASPLGTKEQEYNKGEFAHFMLKEIMEEPQAIRTAVMQDERSFTRWPWISSGPDR